MISVDELKKKATARYTDFLRSYYSDSLSSFFPLVIPCNKGSPHDDLGKRSQELKALYEASKNNGKKSYAYESELVSTRMGVQTVITKIFFEDQEDFLTFINKKKEFGLLQKVGEILLGNLHSSFSEKDIKDWLVRHQEKVCSPAVEGGIDSFWNTICLCVNWLYENPQSNLYLRSVPLEVHSKFIENNQSLIHSLLTSEKITKERTFIKQHGLADKPSFIRFRLLDRLELAEGFKPTEMILTAEDFKKLPLARFLKDITRIIVIENEMVYLSFPKVKNTICVWGHGFTAGQFKSFAWLDKYELFYFGDLDEHGYDILSIFRAAFPKTRSFCMDMKTFKEFDRFRVKGESLKGPAPSNLTDEELLVFGELKKNGERNRLEQERISQQWIMKQGQIAFNEALLG